MKITKGQIDGNGKHTCTVELEDGEMLKGYFLNRYYQMGDPVDAVVRGGHILSSREVYWCAVEQRWVDAE